MLCVKVHVDCVYGNVCRWCGGSLNVKQHVSVHSGNPQQIQHAQQLINQKCDMMVSQ